MRAAPLLSSLKALSAVETNNSPTKKKAHPMSAVAGLLLMDSLLRPIAFNDEAVEILSYPHKVANVSRADAFLAGRIRSTLMGEQSSCESPFVAEFRSGRRRYLCPVFVVDGHAKDPSRPSIAVLLVRASSVLIALSHVSHQYKFTRREQEALEYLLQGLSNKEIANRMNVSPNTVKVFLRLIMVKIGVGSRSAIVGKIIQITT